MRVFIDMGHGGNDPGAEGNGLREEDVTQKIGRRLVAALSLYQNVETRVGPRPIGTTSRSRLQPRTDAANAWHPETNEIALNGHPLESSTIQNGTGYAAAREIGRVIGAAVEWVGETRTVRFQLPGQSEPGAQGTAEP